MGNSVLEIEQEQGVFELVCEVIAEVLEMDVDEISGSQSLIDDLGADSLDIVDLSYSLGKRLNIKMPNKTIIVHAEEACEQENFFAVDGVLTDHGAKLLQQSINRYSEEQATAGMSLADVFCNTTVENWGYMCQSILNSQARSGDVLILAGISQYLEHVS